MTREKIVAAAQQALGGLDRLRSVRSFHATLRRTYDSDDRASTVTIWRAAGGHIRVEEVFDDGERRVRATGRGQVSPDDAADLVRDARVAPRNMLAHAGEHRIALRRKPAPDGSYILSLPDGFALYFIDSRAFLCVLMIDLARDRRTEYGDYRVVDGIATPFRELHSLDAQSESYEDVYEHVVYNAVVPPGLFD